MEAPRRLGAKVGAGMKPRPGQRVAKSSVLSTNEGQTKSIIQPVLKRFNQEVSDMGLDPKNEKISAKNEAENEPIVAVVEKSEEKQEEVADFSRMVEDAIVAGSAIPEENLPQESPEFFGIHALPPDEAGKPTIADMEAAIERGEVLTIDPDGKVYSEQKFFQADLVGFQANGEYKAVVTIKEGYWNAVEEWAAADGLTPEEWLSNLVTANIETYAMPAKGR